MKRKEDLNTQIPNTNIWNEKLKASPFVVPENYFEQLEDITSFTVKQLNNQQIPWELPNQYFDQLQDRIQTRIFLEEQTQKFDLQKESFDVPEGYFEGLQANILNSIHATKEESVKEDFAAEHLDNVRSIKRDINRNIDRDIKKSIAPRRKNVLFKWTRVAAAACLVIVGGLFIKNLSSPTMIESNLENIPDTEIINYLSTFSTTGDWVNISNAVSESATANNSNNVSDLSDEDIRWFLENSL